MENIKNKLSAGYFFLSLGVLASLIASVVSFLNLAFEILDKKFPDVLNAVYQYGYNSYQFDNARTALATLIIVFPALLVLVYLWKKIQNKGLQGYDVTAHKWLTYIIIFLSGIIVLTDLIVLVRYFVSGEITIRFIFKILFVAGAAKMVLFYFLPEVWQTKWVNVFKKIATYFSMFIVLALIVWSFMVIGSPMQQRDLRLDDKRMQDLQSIQSQVTNFYQQKQKLPAKITDLANPLSGYSLPVDPEFEKGKVYEYIPKEKLTFEICANFSLPMPKGWQENQSYSGGVMPVAVRDITTTNVETYPYPGTNGVNNSWDHQAGRTCFERTIDKDMYPPYPKAL
ncbi:DUF5671 domain-containing protein [Candidatus Nomurabacteria bacterium]|nr:DUF5671 domain-containing protein [Candidatus Nomurabacteria bacterium]